MTKDEQDEGIREHIDQLFEAALGAAEGDENVRRIYHELLAALEENRSLEETVQHNYDEILAAHEVIDRERHKFRELFDLAPDAYLITDLMGNITRANLAAGHLLNVRHELLERKSLMLFIEPSSKSIYHQLLKVVDKVGNIELGLTPPKKPRIDALVTITPVFSPLHEPVGLHWIIRDITLQKMAIMNLTASEERLRTIFQENHVGMCLADLNGLVIDANPAFQEMVGYDLDMLRGKPLDWLIHTEDRPTINAALSRLQIDHMDFSINENRIVTRAEQIIWVHFSVSLLRDGRSRPQFYFYIFENVTNQHQTANELAETKRRLLHSGDEERMRLARELHDGPIQEIYGAIFHLNSAKSFIDIPDAESYINETEKILKDVANNLRTICGELRPPILAHLGLEKAIRAYVDRVVDHHPEMVIELDLQCKEDNLPHEMGLQIFRIFQQCLSNIVRHAHASQVRVTLKMDDKDVLMQLVDNGQGFQPPKKWVNFIRMGHYGLAGAAERASILNGHLRVSSTPGNGTQVDLKIPYRES